MGSSLPAVKRFGVNIELPGAFFNRELQREPTVPELLTEAFRSQKGNDLGFVDIGVPEATESERVIAEIITDDTVVRRARGCRLFVT